MVVHADVLSIPAATSFFMVSTGRATRSFSILSGQETCPAGDGTRRHEKRSLLAGRILFATGFDNVARAQCDVLLRVPG